MTVLWMLLKIAAQMMLMPREGQMIICQLLLKTAFQAVAPLFHQTSAQMGMPQLMHSAAVQVDAAQLLQKACKYHATAEHTSCPSFLLRSFQLLMPFPPLLTQQLVQIAAPFPSRAVHHPAHTAHCAQKTPVTRFSPAHTACSSLRMTAANPSLAFSPTAMSECPLPSTIPAVSETVVCLSICP